MTNHPTSHRFANLNGADIRGGGPIELPPEQQMPPLNMQILHCGVAVANMGLMERVPSLGVQITAWETALGLAPPNPGDAQVVAVGRVLARAQEELRAIFKPASVTAEPTEALPEPPEWKAKLVEGESDG